jgi:1,4-dihydroxy-2-naphthoyl-CoA hydrolase
MDQEMLAASLALTVAEGTLPGRMGITIVSASAERVVATMPVAGNTQPYGLLHGGASCVLAETIGSLGAFLHAGPGRVVVGIEISATHHRGVRDGEVTAVATLAHGGRTLATYDIVVTDAAGHRVCTARLTCLIRDQVPGATGPARIIRADGELSVADHRTAGGTPALGASFAPRAGWSLTW